MEKFYRWVGGYMEMQMTGYSPERFLNLCSARGIEIWDLWHAGEGYGFFMRLKDFRRIRPLARKSGVRLKIRQRMGLPFFLRKNRNRVGFTGGMCLFFVILYSLSLFIWDIQIQGNRRYTYETVTDFLQDREITWGMLKSQLDCQALESALRDYFPEITWAAARISGTRLLISVKENEALSQIPEKQEMPCDVVASKDGIISSIVVRQGIAQVKAGDTVKEGQVLISGEIPIYDDSGQVAAVRYVPADGDVTAVTRYDFSEQFPRIHTVQWETGRRKTGFYLQAGPWSFVFLLPEGEKEQWVYLTETSQAKLFSNFYLPVYWGEIQGKEVEYYESFYTESEMEQVSEGIYQNFVKNLNEKGVQIIQNDVKILEDESVCRMEGTVTALESVTRIQEITELKETENLEYERSGEYH